MKSLIGICVVSAALLSGCGPDPRSTRIVARVGSPDETRDVVYAEDMSGGATVGPSEEVYVVVKGGLPRAQDRVFSQEHVCNLRVRWMNNETIEIAYSAKAPLVARSNVPDRLDVHIKWLGPDASNGC
jgi:hypothetical protein